MCIPRMAARIVAGNVTVERLKKPTPRGLLCPDLDRTRCRSIVSSRKTPFLYGIHGRKVVASLKEAGLSDPRGVVGEYPRPKGRGLIEGGARRAPAAPPLPYPRSRYPRPKGRGLIEGSPSGEGVNPAAMYPRPKGRGLIEGSVWATGRRLPAMYPRPKGRGLIEGLMTIQE